MSVPRLNPDVAQRLGRLPPRPQRVRIVQFGEGRFVRAFFDWLIEGSGWGIAALCHRPGGRARIAELAAQGGLFTVYEPAAADAPARSEIVGGLVRPVDPFSSWDAVLALAADPEVGLMVSNSTEAGLAYAPDREEAPETFPGRLAACLRARYARLGEAAPPLLILPLELQERNGDLLRQAVRAHAEAWGAGEGFLVWLDRRCRFLTTLVDRIVLGPPGEEDPLWAELGYYDPFLCRTEPYHLLVIEAEAELSRLLPSFRSGASVVLTQDITPYYARKVRLLNGLHTMLALLALPHGLTTVAEALAHPQVGPLVLAVIDREVRPTVPLPEEEVRDYLAQVVARMRRPAMPHLLRDIALNTVTKWRARLWPPLREAWRKAGEPPPGLCLSLASLIYALRAAPAPGEAPYPFSGEEDLRQGLAERLAAEPDRAAFLRALVADDEAGPGGFELLAARVWPWVERWAAAGLAAALPRPEDLR